MRQSMILYLLGSFFLGVAIGSIVMGIILRRNRQPSQQVNESDAASIEIGTARVASPMGQTSIDDDTLVSGASEESADRGSGTRPSTPPRPTAKYVRNRSEPRSPRGSRQEMLGESRLRDEPHPPSEPQAGDLIGVWNTYRHKGDGHFNAKGLQRQLEDAGFEATVSKDRRVMSSDCVLVVETKSKKPLFFVLPSFAKSPTAVEPWYFDQRGGALNRRIERVSEVAEGRWTTKGSEVTKTGSVA